MERVARRLPTRGRAWTTSATAPARAWPATAWATRSSGATTSVRSTRPPATRSSGTRARTRSRATRPWRPPRAACSPVVTRLPGRASVGRVAFFDFSQDPGNENTDTTITDPIEGRVEPTGTPFTITGSRQGRQRRRQPRPGRGPGPQHRPVPAGRRHHVQLRVEHDQRDPVQPERDRCRLLAVGDRSPTNRTLKVFAKTYRQQRHQRPDQGHQEDRDLRHRRPDADRPASPGRAAASSRRRRSPSPARRSDDVGVNRIRSGAEGRRPTATCSPTASTGPIDQHVPRHADVVGERAEHDLVATTSPSRTRVSGARRPRPSTRRARPRCDSAARTGSSARRGVAPTVTILTPAIMNPPTACRDVHASRRAAR